MKQQMGRVGRLINAHQKTTFGDSPFTIFPLSAPVAPNAPVTLSWSCLDSNSRDFCDQAFVIAETLVPNPTDSISTSEHIIDVHQVLTTVNPAHDSTFSFTVAPEGPGIFELIASLAAPGTDPLTPTVYPGPTITVMAYATQPTISHASAGDPTLSQEITPTSLESNAIEHLHSKTAIIAGSVAGSAVFISLAIILTIFLLRRRRNQLQHQPGTFRRDLMIRPRKILDEESPYLKGLDAEKRMSRNFTSASNNCTEGESQTSLVDHGKKLGAGTR